MKHGVHPKVASERRGQADMTLTLTTTGPVLPQMHADAAGGGHGRVCRDAHGIKRARVTSA